MGRFLLLAGLTGALLFAAGCQAPLPVAQAPASPAPAPPLLPLPRVSADPQGPEAWTTGIGAAGSSLAARDAAPATPDAVPDDFPGLDPALLEAGPWVIQTYATSVIIPGAQLTHRDADVDLWLGRLRVEAKKNLGNAARLSFDVVYERSDYDFKGSSFIFAAADPVGPINSWALRGRIIFPFHEDGWAAFLFATTVAEAEEGADLLDGVSSSLTGGIGRIFANGLQIGVGAAFIWRPEEDLLILPAVQFVWEYNDCWEFSLDGPELEALYKVSPKFSWGMSLGFRSLRARMVDVPAANGLFTDSRLPLQLRAYWYPHKNWRIEGRVGVDLYRELFFEDEHGKLIESFMVKPTPHFMMRIRYTF